MKDEYSQIIVKRILELCRQRDFTIYQLSAMSGISYSTLENKDASQDRICIQSYVI